MITKESIENAVKNSKPRKGKAPAPKQVADGHDAWGCDCGNESCTGCIQCELGECDCDADKP